MTRLLYWFRARRSLVDEAANYRHAYYAARQRIELLNAKVAEYERRGAV